MSLLVSQSLHLFCVSWLLCGQRYVLICKQLGLHVNTTPYKIGYRPSGPIGPPYIGRHETLYFIKLLFSKMSKRESVTDHFDLPFPNKDREQRYVLIGKQIGLPTRHSTRLDFNPVDKLGHRTLEDMNHSTL